MNESNLMKDQIVLNIENPQQLEYLYRTNPTEFKKGFEQAYSEFQSCIPAQFWFERLREEYPTRKLITQKSWILILTLSLMAGFTAKIPHFTNISEEWYYPRNLGFVVFPMLIILFSILRKQKLTYLLTVLFFVFLSAVYINILPSNNSSDTLILACIHLPLFLWSLLGFSYSGFNLKNNSLRIDFIRYNADLLILSTLLVLSLAILSAASISLFSLLGLHIEEFYFRNIAIWVFAAIPIVGSYLVYNNSTLVKHISPLIARGFAPLVLIMLVAYLIAMLTTGKDPYNDREFLIVFNLLLIGVLAIIFFSLVENFKVKINRWNIIILLMLSLLTIVINGIALSAILFRISQWGITPNRIAVFGSNILILINLCIVSFLLFKSIKNTQNIQKIESQMANYLFIYGLWTTVVTFLFPIIFGFN